MPNRRVLPASVLTALALLAGSLFGPAPRVALGEPLSPPLAIVDVMTLNIFYGGDDLNIRTGDFCAVADGCRRTLQQVEHVIDSSGADIVGIEEGERNAGVIADALGWYASDRLQVISRYPIVDPPGANGRYVWVEVLPGRFVAVGNAHLPSDPYGPYGVRDGATLEETLALEASARLPAIQKHIDALAPLAADGFPTFLVGDFNSPSHLDWGADVAAVRPDVPFAVDWPVSQALADAGFRDSYRELYPDPVAVPGFTWTPGGPESVPDEVHDRIDWVLSSGPTEVLDSQIVGEAGGPDVGIGFDPWPTDHRGVVSRFKVSPKQPDPFVATSRQRNFKGAPIQVRYRAGDVTGQQVAIVPRGAGPSKALKHKAVGPPGAANWSTSFGTGGLAPGAYDAVLVSGGSVISRAPFWLYKAGTSPSVRTTKTRYVVGEPIGVRWRAAPGFRWDWIGVYAAGKRGVGNYLVYAYTSTKVQGGVSIGPDSFPGLTTWPLKPGTYVVRLLKDDSYHSLATSETFRIVRP